MGRVVGDSRNATVVGSGYVRCSTFVYESVAG